VEDWNDSYGVHWDGAAGGEEGDAVVAVKGARVPLVLRPAVQKAFPVVLGEPILPIVGVEGSKVPCKKRKAETDFLVRSTTRTRGNIKKLKHFEESRIGDNDREILLPFLGSVLLMYYLFLSSGSIRRFSSVCRQSMSCSHSGTQRLIRM
jgi:hypothetical protein